LHGQVLNTNPNKSMFEITPIETASLVNPDIVSEPVSNKHDELDVSVVKGNEEEIKGDYLIKLNASLEKLDEEWYSITEKLNQLVQRLLIVQKEEQLSENVIEEKLNLQQDYKSLSDIFNRELNYSTNDLDSLGRGYNQRRDGNLMMKNGVENSVQVHKFDADIKKHDKLAIQEEIDKLHEKLEHVKSEREFINQLVKSLKEGV
jgi:hypothetical protein